MKHSAKLFSLLVAYLFMAQLTYAHRWYVDNSIRVNTYYLDFNISVSRSFAQGNVVVHDFVLHKNDSDNEKISDQVSCIGDLALFDLHGRVKTAMIEQSDETCLGLPSAGEYEFNQEGSLTKSDGFPVEEYLPNIGYTREGRDQVLGKLNRCTNIHIKMENWSEFGTPDTRGRVPVLLNMTEWRYSAWKKRNYQHPDYGTGNYRTNKLKKLEIIP